MRCGWTPSLALLIGVAGCVTTQLTPEAMAIRVTANPEAVKGCKYLGAVEGKDTMNGGMLGQGAAEENAMRKIRNHAAEMKANVVFLVPQSTKFSGSHQRGEAYHCENPSQ
jgi:hypothetical protein